MAKVVNKYSKHRLKKHQQSRKKHPKSVKIESWWSQMEPKSIKMEPKWSLNPQKSLHGSFWDVFGAQSRPGRLPNARCTSGLSVFRAFLAESVTQMGDFGTPLGRQGAPKSHFFAQNQHKIEKKSIQEGFQKKHEKSIEKSLKNGWFLRCRFLIIEPWWEPQLDFTFSMFSKKTWKIMKNGPQNVMKIHEKWSRGRPKVDFWSSGVDFGRFEKTSFFRCRFGTSKNL